MTNLQIFERLEERRISLSKGPYHTCACCGSKIQFGCYHESQGLKFCNTECIWRYEEEGVNHLAN